MLSESVLGPLWAYLFVSERPSIFSLIGGATILLAVLIQFYTLEMVEHNLLQEWVLDLIGSG